MAKNVVVVGTQWGDEGKGKIVDWLTDHAHGVVRFQGGHNAGHTLVVGANEYKLNLVPSEIAKGAGKIGTTGRGIGPTYEDKVARRALRVYDLFDRERFAAKLRANLEYHNFVLTQHLGAEAVAFEAVFEQAMADAEEIRPMVADVSAELYAVNKSGGSLLFEGRPDQVGSIHDGKKRLGRSSRRATASRARRRRARASVRVGCTTCWGSPRLTVRGSAAARFRPSWTSSRRARPANRCRRKAVNSAP